MSTLIIEKALQVALAALQALAPGLLEKAGKLLAQLAPREVREVLAQALEKLGDTANALLHSAIEFMGGSCSAVGNEAAEMAKEYADKLLEMARKLREESATTVEIEIAAHDPEKLALTYLVDEKSMKGWVEEVENKVEKVTDLLKKHAELKYGEAGDNKIVMDPTVKVGPWGGDGGNPFSVQGLLTKITVVSTQQNVFSIQFTYLDNSNIEKDSPKYGSFTPNDAKSRTIIIKDGEKITGISGTVGSHDRCWIVITSLCITIGKDINHTFGTPSGTPFKLPVTLGMVSGFFGRSGVFLDSLGVILSPSY